MSTDDVDVAVDGECTGTDVVDMSIHEVDISIHVAETCTDAVYM